MGLNRDDGRRGGGEEIGKRTEFSDTFEKSSSALLCYVFVMKDGNENMRGRWWGIYIYLWNECNGIEQQEDYLESFDCGNSVGGRGRWKGGIPSYVRIHRTACSMNDMEWNGCSRVK